MIVENRCLFDGKEHVYYSVFDENSRHLANTHTRAEAELAESKTLSFQDACAQYPYRYTMEHKPAWADKPAPNGKYYAPNYRTDMEWYLATSFPPFEDFPRNTDCQATGQTWPLGKWLDTPYEVKH